MGKTNKINNAYDKAISKRVPIMLGLSAIVLILFFIGLGTITYINNTVDPYENEEVTYTSIEYLNENFFRINEEDIFLTKWIVEDTDGNGLESSTVTLSIKIGNISQSYISSVNIETYLCYNWAKTEDDKEIMFKGSTSNSGQTTRTFSLSNVDMSFDKKPNIFTKVDLRDDAKFFVAFSFTNEESINTKYVVKMNWEDLYISGETALI